VSSVAPAAAPARAARYRFVVLGVVWCAYLVVFLSRLCVGPLSPFLKDSFHLSHAQIGWLTSATAVAYAPTLVLAGWLVDRIGARRALIIGTLITGVSVGAVALAPSYEVMLLLLACSGFGCGFIYPTAVKAIMMWFPQQERATAVGVNQSAVNISGMLGAAIMPSLALSLGWQSGFVLAAIMAFVICGVAVAFYRDPRPGESAALTPAAPRAGSATAPEAQLAAPTAFSELEQGLPLVTGDERLDRAAVSPGFLAVLRSRDILLEGFAAMFLCVIEFSALAQLVLFLKGDWAFTAVAAGGLLAFCQGAGAVGKPVSGLVSDRLLGGRRRPALMALAGLAGVACAILALIRPGQTPALWLALALLGVGAVGWGGLLGTLAGETAGPAAAGAAAGVTAALDNIGIFVGPPLFGWIVDRTGTYAPAWWTMVGAAVLAVILLAFVREPRRPMSRPAAYGSSDADEHRLPHEVAHRR
jgi:MFS transporter, ACS family, hexuronate transporter